MQAVGPLGQTARARSRRDESSSSLVLLTVWRLLLLYLLLMLLVLVNLYPMIYSMLAPDNNDQKLRAWNEFEL